jgi:starch phosphorylase
MSYLQIFQVFPDIPQPLAFLETLSRNLWWCWNLDAIELFRRIDPRLWERAGRNPILFATLISQERIEALAEDEAFLAHQERVRQAFQREVLEHKAESAVSFGKDVRIAYFSMEFGIHESLPLFSGGLGVLAGDHLKAASDQGLPLVGIGLFYRQGYFQQFLDPSGWQQEDYPETDIYYLPVRRARDQSGQEIHVSLKGPDGPFRALVWEIQVGRIPLYLLDTNTIDNSAQSRAVTARLYAGEQKTRLCQELLLGIGGMQVLQALGLKPAVCHMNEGHCAFTLVERLAQIMENRNVDLPTAREILSRSTVFTTHTPVAAGHDEFPVELVKPCLAPFQERLGVSIEEILSWGRAAGAEPKAPFSMFVMGLRLSQYCNGVSRLHGSTARRMWSHVWPERSDDEVPISHITNGVHIPSWVSVENAMLFERYLGPDWHMHTGDRDYTRRIEQIYDEELWRAREQSRSRLIRSARAIMLRQHGRRNAPKAIMEEAESVLDQEILTVGFARRFATYKRAHLLFQDPDRLEAIITSNQHPVQFIFAGKAHPRDNEGKQTIQRLIEFTRRSSVRHRIVFLENYDINIARHLIQGVDVWLNTPRRPLEACGTSGMKAAVNGVLNLSIMDGWWDEGYSEECGWRIGSGEEYTDHAYQDAVESRALYNLLENDVIPCFYERKNGRPPARWVTMMKASMQMVLRRFCAHLMVEQYTQRFYLPAALRYHELVADNAAEARKLVAQSNRLQKLWPQIGILPPVREADGPFRVGDSVRFAAQVTLGDLQPDEVEVELYYGKIASVDSLVDGRVQPMQVDEARGDGHYLFACEIPCRSSGRMGFTARVTPRGDDRIKFTPGLVTWA